MGPNVRLTATNVQSNNLRDNQQTLISETMPVHTVTNGTHTPETPKPQHAGLAALTEYSANASPPSSTPREKTRSAGVPDALLLPNGYPDVSAALSVPHGLSSIVALVLMFLKPTSE